MKVLVRLMLMVQMKSPPYSAAFAGVTEIDRDAFGRKNSASLVQDALRDVLLVPPTRRAAA